MPVSFDDFAEFNRPVLFHRLPNGVGGFVEEDFVGHGGAKSASETPLQIASAEHEWPRRGRGV